MKNVRTLRKRRAVSPVIATVIIVAVTITVAVAVSYWISGISSQYTQFEKVEIQSAVFTPLTLEASPPHWEIIITLKNSGTKTASLTSVFVNEAQSSYNDIASAPGSYATYAIQASLSPLYPLQIESGASKPLKVWIDASGSYTSLSSGTTVNIKIHSAAGMDYIRLVQLT